jgi:hypothetical protein
MDRQIEMKKVAEEIVDGKTVSEMFDFCVELLVEEYKRNRVIYQFDKTVLEDK